MTPADMERTAPDQRRRAYEFGLEATGPVAEICDQCDDVTLALVEGTREAGREVPVLSLQRDASAGTLTERPAGLVVISGIPHVELAALPLGLAGAVVRGQPDRESADRELAVLREHLGEDGPVLDLGRAGHTRAARPAFPPVSRLAAKPEAPADPQLEQIAADLAQAQQANRQMSETLGGTRARLRRTLIPGGDQASPVDARSEADQPVTVVIAIHNAHDDVIRCVESVIRHTSVPHEVLLIDDASTDERIASLVERYAASHDRVQAIRNPHNLGYTVTINLGCAVSPGDVVLLNSDTEVPPGWLDRLHRTAYSRPDVATVTPVSNAAGAFSVPETNVDAGLPEGVGVAEMAELVAHVSPHARPIVPTGNGFCLYIRRQALDRAGHFDEVAFPRGYGEENDFCQRAMQTGLVNLIDDAAFVYHRRSGSFGAAKADLVANAKEQLAVMHPSYTAQVKEFLDADPLAELRHRTAAILDRGAPEVRAIPSRRPTVLVVLHAGEGGTPQTNHDLMTSLADRFRCLTLRCDIDRWTLTEARPTGEGMPVQEVGFREPWETAEPLDQERTDAIRRICHEHQVALVHIRSFIANGPELVSTVRGMGLPVICSLHDFYTVCPTIQLLDNGERFCGGHCTPGAGTCATSKRWVRNVPRLKHEYVYPWRERMAEHMAKASAFVTTSEAAADVLVDHFDFMRDRIQVTPHGRDVGRHRSVSVPPGPLARVVSFGAHGPAKGIGLMEALMALDQERGPRFEFHFVGTLHPRFRPELLGGVAHGAYERGQLPDTLAQIQPSFSLVASIWPETYCHTLTESWMSDIPVFASDIGTLRERVRSVGGGWLLDHTDPSAFYEGMRLVLDQPVEWHLKRSEIARMSPRTIDEMAAEYAGLYERWIAREQGDGPTAALTLDGADTAALRSEVERSRPTHDVDPERFEVDVSMPELNVAGDRPVVFHGVNKSGSLALSKVIHDAYWAAGRQREFISTYHRVPGDQESFARLLATQQGPGFFVGHYIYRSMALPADATLVTQLRHPLSRTLSVYGWLKRNHLREHGSLDSYPDLEEWLLTSKGRRATQMTQFAVRYPEDLAKLRSTDAAGLFEESMQNFERDVAWFGIAELFEESIFALAHLCRLPDVAPWASDNRNKWRDSIEETDPRLVDLIREVYPLEFRFYDHWLGMFERRLERIDFGPSLAPYKARCAGAYKERYLRGGQAAG